MLPIPPDLEAPPPRRTPGSMSWIGQQVRWGEDSVGLLLSAYCRFNLRGRRVLGTFGKCHNQGQDVTLAGKEATLLMSKINNQCGDLIENKGSISEVPGSSRNLIENKGTYNQEAGILLKTKG
jgi:hypothetical protein